MRKETNARGANPRDYSIQRTVHSEFLDQKKTIPNPLAGKPKMVKHNKTT
jgi:hypothetical protein